jgi:hypothetical protein
MLLMLADEVTFSIATLPVYRTLVGSRIIDVGAHVYSSAALVALSEQPRALRLPWLLIIGGKVRTCTPTLQLTMLEKGFGTEEPQFPVSIATPQKHDTQVMNAR